MMFYASIDGSGSNDLSIIAPRHQRMGERGRLRTTSSQQSAVSLCSENTVTMPNSGRHLSSKAAPLVEVVLTQHIAKQRHNNTRL